MKKMFQVGVGGFRPSNVMLYQERNEAQEFGRPRKGTGVCARCGAMCRSKAWHHPDAARRRLVEQFHAQHALVARNGKEVRT